MVSEHQLERLNRVYKFKLGIPFWVFYPITSDAKTVRLYSTVIFPALLVPTKYL